MTRSSWLLTTGGALTGLCAAVDLASLDRDGWPVWRHFATPAMMMLLGGTAIAASLVAMAASLWRLDRRRSWHLAGHGLALGTFGGLLAFWRGPLSFRVLALLIVLMAVSFGLFARHLHLQAKWLRGAAMGSFAFAAAFLGFAFDWVPMGPRPFADFLWFGSFFAFTALCEFGLAIRLSGVRSADPQT
jgi:hypothetical protein